MPDATGITTGLIHRLNTEDRKDFKNALDELIAHTYERLKIQVRLMMRKERGLSRWLDEEDLHHNALMRLAKALEATNKPGAKNPVETSRHYYRLASTQINRELIDIARSYYGPRGIATNHHSDPEGKAIGDKSDDSCEPTSLAEWVEFHQVVRELPEDQREIFNLIYYQGMTRAAAAASLKISRKDLGKKFALAKAKVGEAINVLGR